MGVREETASVTAQSTARITARSILIGICVVLVVNVWATYAEMYVRSSRLTIAHFPVAVFVIFIAILYLNRRLGHLLTSVEILVILSMGLVGAVMPVEGVVGFLLGIISSLYYFASPENQWSEYFHPYLARWLVPQGNDAVWRQFFEGEGLEQGISWGMWAVPLAWWASFILTTLWVSACLVVILRKQWVDHERLAFPLSEVAIRLLDDEEERVTRSGLFWAGAAIPFLLLCWQVFGWYRPGLPLTDVLPEIPPRFRITRYSVNIVVNPFQFFTVGFGYFASVEVLLGIWFFFLVHLLEGSIFNRIGYTLRAAGSDLFCGRPAHMAWQGFGAFCFMVGWGVWIGRHHLREVFRCAVQRGVSVDDRGEMMSYRTAVWGGAVGLLFLLEWLHQSGMEYQAAALFLLCSFIIYVGMGRLVAEAGLLYTWGTLSPQSFVVNILGSSSISGYGMTSILLSYGLINYLRGLFLPSLTQVARFSDRIRGGERRLMVAVLLGATIGLAVSFAYTLNLAYQNGAYNTYGFPRFFGGDPKAIFSNTLSKVRNPFGPDWTRLLFALIGAGVMAVLTLLRSRISWWRISPLGFVTSSMINTVHLVIPIFFAWVIKSIVLSLGGVILYRKTMPFFLGMIVGYAAGVTVCFFVDAVWYPHQGHLVHGW